MLLKTHTHFIRVNHWNPSLFANFAIHFPYSQWSKTKNYNQRSVEHWTEKMLWHLLSLCLGYIIKYLKYLWVCYYMSSVCIQFGIMCVLHYVYTKTLFKKTKLSIFSIEQTYIHFTYVEFVYKHWYRRIICFCLGFYFEVHSILYILDEESYHSNFNSKWLNVKDMCGGGEREQSIFIFNVTNQ